jgi:hypothetical protein
MDAKYYLNDLENDSLERKMEKLAASLLEAQIIMREVIGIDGQLHIMNINFAEGKVRDVRDFEQRVEGIMKKKEKVWEEMFEADDIYVRLYLSIAQHFSVEVVDENGDTMKELDREAMKTAIHKIYPGLMDLYDEIFEFVDDLYDVMQRER